MNKTLYPADELQNGRSDDGFSVCYFGSYNPSYPRAKVFINGLTKNGVKVIECRSDIKNRIFRIVDLAVKYLSIFKKIDIILVCEAGQSYVLLAKVLSLITHKPLAFDAFLSYFHAKTAEGDTNPKSILGFYYYILDKTSCLLADVIFLDTQEHVNFFVHTFSIKKEKFRSVLVGSDDSIFYPRENSSKNDKVFKIFNVSSFYPLHGVEYIIKAAKILEDDKEIEFLIYGNGHDFKKAEKLISDMNLENTKLLGKIDIRKLPEIMAGCDLCLGNFGGTIHSDMVISTKVFDALAMGKPVITAENPSVRNIFSDGVNVLFCKSHDPQSLADAIIRLKNNKKLANNLGENGRKFFISHASTEIIGREIRGYLSELLGNKN